MPNFDKETFEQPRGNIPVGLVIVLAPFVYFFDLPLICRKKYGLDIVMDKVRIDILPAEFFAKPLLVGEPETGAAGSPKAHAFPALGFETFVKQPGAEEEHVFEEFGQEFLAGLNQGAFRRRKLSGLKPPVVANYKPQPQPKKSQKPKPL